MPGRMSAIVEVAPQLIATATLHVETPGVGFTDITENAASFIKQVGVAAVGVSAHLSVVDDPEMPTQTCNQI